MKVLRLTATESATLSAVLPTAAEVRLGRPQPSPALGMVRHLQSGRSNDRWHGIPVHDPNATDDPAAAAYPIIIDPGRIAPDHRAPTATTDAAEHAPTAACAET